MGEMAKFPYLSGRKGSKNLYYKRMVPLELRGAGRPAQIWRSLKTADRKSAERAYAATHAEVELQFAQWRKEDTGDHASAPPLDVSNAATPLTPSLLRRLADAHYLDVYDNDFRWRGDLWQHAHQSEDAFWRGDIIRLPSDDWAEFKGKPHSYYAHLMEEPLLEDVFLYAVFRERQRRLHGLRKSLKLGDGSRHRAAVDALLRARGLSLSDADHLRLVRKLMETEIRALEDLGAGSEIAFDSIVDRNAEETNPSQTSCRAAPAELFSSLIEKYLDETSRAREWPVKTILRKRSELREFMEIAGDKPVNAYAQVDGVEFKDIQLALPINRQRPPFKGLGRVEVAEMATKLRMEGTHVELLNPITIKDKLGTVALFFAWAKARDSSVVNPVADQRVEVRRNKRGGKKRHPWTIDELNRMFAAPVFTGCRSLRHWKQPGIVVLRDSAKYWVPLIALFSGLRLGEIIQMQVADVKTLEGIQYFDVTPVGFEDADEEGDDPTDEKSLKTASSRRAVPIHTTLLDLGFDDFLASQREKGESRLFPEFTRAQDDGSWSKRFSKYFKRFRESIGVTRRGVKFHSLRHNVEDALRNADVRKEVRDAIQGHSESGVSREYGSGYYLRTLNEAVQMIHYDGVLPPPRF
jgi:integrase